MWRTNSSLKQVPLMTQQYLISSKDLREMSSQFKLSLNHLLVFWAWKVFCIPAWLCPPDCIFSSSLLPSLPEEISSLRQTEEETSTCLVSVTGVYIMSVYINVGFTENEIKGIKLLSNTCMRTHFKVIVFVFFSSGWLQLQFDYQNTTCLSHSNLSHWSPQDF